MFDEFCYVFTTCSTRPLSIVNSDNRNLANVFRLKITPLLEAWVSDAQPGFIKGRCLLSNVVELDAAAMRIGLISSRGAIILYHFRAAFPCIFQEYLWAVLSSLGMPQTLIQAL